MRDQFTWRLDHQQPRAEANQFDIRRQRSEGSFKLRVPSFLGENDLDVYLEWEKEMDLVFNYQHYTEEKKVRKAASTFMGHAINWWEETAFIRRYLGESQITSWFEMKAVMKKRFVSAYNGRDVHPKLRKMYQNSRSVDGYYQKRKTLPVRAPQIEQQSRRRNPIQSPLETPSKPPIFKDEKSGVKPEEEHQNIACNQGDKEESPNTPLMTKNVESFKCQDEEPDHERKAADVDYLVQEEVLDTRRTLNAQPKEVYQDQVHLKQERKETTMTHELDLRSNPFKGGGDGVILNGPSMISSLSREDHEQHGTLRVEEQGLDISFDGLELNQEEAAGWAQDGMDLDARTHGAKKAHTFKTFQEIMPCLKPNKRLCNVWVQTKEEKEEKRPPELKPNKKPFY